MAIMRWDPFQDTLPLRDAMNRLFEDSLVRFSGTPGFSVGIPMDVYTEGDNYVIEVTVPGLNPDAVNVSVLANQVTISGEYPAAPEGRRYLFHELPRGRFERTITLPSELEVDKAQGHYEHGLLRLTVPKAEAAKPRRIALTAGQ
jgi:HSP20 family protein